MLETFKFDTTIDIGTILLAFSILVSVVLFIIAQASEGKKTRAATQRGIYQKLELASIDLFRFEADHGELARRLWEDDEQLPVKGSKDEIVLIGYISQLLCLFEMALSFRKQKIMTPEIFGSWVLWFHELCFAQNFRKLWPAVAYQFTCDLRRIMAGGIQIAEKNSDDELKSIEEFFNFVADELKCDVIRNWFACESANGAISGKCVNCSAIGKNMLDYYKAQ